MQLYTKRTILHILFTVGYWTATCYETDVVFCDFNTVFQAVSFKSFVESSQIVTRPAHYML